MSIYVSGSLAYDRIMTFPGKFQDHILPEKLHILNVSFMVDRMEEKRGGCAGNIAYTLALLGEKPILLAAGGRDFANYAEFLTGLGLTLEGIRLTEDVFTATCNITTDFQSNQITGFHPGAMTLGSEYTFPNLDPAADIAIVSPGNLDDMRRLPKYFREKKVPYIYDPGQQLPVLSGDELLDGLTGSFAMTTNDYELNLICNKTGKTKAELQTRTQWLVTTYGEKGSAINGDTFVTIPAVPPRQVVDPTGAGDAHRGGLIKGLRLGLSMPEAACMAATAASFAVEEYGTQAHSFDKATFLARHTSAFPDSILPW
ncbi:MAG: carbohydrate kinase family protein [Desulfovibrionaceae bacterium]